MRVTAKRQAKMSNIVGAIISLRLAAKHRLHDLRADLLVDDFLKNCVERLGLDHLAQREVDFKGLEIFLKRNKLFAAWRFMGAVNQG